MLVNLDPQHSDFFFGHSFETGIVLSSTRATYIYISPNQKQYASPFYCLFICLLITVKALHKFEKICMERFSILFFTGID